MQLSRRCKSCKEWFKAIKTTQLFCCRKCFKKDYYYRLRQKQAIERSSPSFPDKYCQVCSTKMILQFDPIKAPHLYDELECPKCHTTNTMVWHNSDYKDSQQRILQLVSANLVERKELDTTRLS